jgi:gliding motility-associated-like protein
MNLPIHIQNTRTGRMIVSCFFLALLFSQKAFAQPTISSISPTSASVGATVIIIGTNFNTTPANNTVFFGPVKATVTFATGTSLSVTVPAGASYSQINVLNVITGLSATSSQFFLPVFSPNKPGLITADITVQGEIGGGVPSRLYSIGANDLNNDGKPDIVMTSGEPGDNRVYIRRNTSTITSVAFASTVTLTIASGVSGADGQISFGDLDGDSRPDIVVPGGDANAFVILKNNSGVINAGNFSPTMVSSALNTTGSAISDLDLDGKPDIVVTNYGSSNIMAYPNASTPGSIAIGAGITMTGTAFQSTQVVTADLDGDGKPEIIAPQSTFNLVYFYRNTSTPGAISFNAGQSLAVFSSGLASSITIADLNNDGKPDMIVTDGDNTTANSIAILRNTSTVGSITFSVTTQQIATAPYDQKSASFADMNGDGKPDLVLSLNKNFDVSPSFDFRIAVMYNTSVGNNISFSSPIEYLSGNTALGYNIIASDINGDGIPDILVPTGNTANISVYRGSPQFAPTITSLSTLSASTNSNVVITGTGFNSTTTSNIVEFGTVTGTVTAASTTSLTVKVPANASYGPISVLNKSNTLSALSQDRFMPAVTPNKSALAATDFVQQAVFSVTGSLYGMAAGDLTGDGKPELVITNSGNTSSLIILGNISTIGGPIAFGTPTIFTPTSGYDGARYVSLADMDGNGWLDIVVPSFNLSAVGVFLNSGTGTVSTSFTLTGSFTTGMGPIGVATGDLDGDGKPDIVTSNDLGSSVSVFRNTSTNINAVSFAGKQDYDVSAPNQVFNVALADIDNDGKLDIIAGRDAGVNSKVVLLRNTSTVGNISFAAAVEIAGPNAPWTIAPGDLNGDGLTDFVVGAGGGSATEIFAYTKLSSGGALTNLGTTQLNVSQANIAIGLADLNGDGKPDVISGTRDAVPGYFTYIYPNTTTGTTTSFGTRIDMAGRYDPWSTLATDLNADGRPDIVMGNQQTSQSSIIIFRNTLIAPPVTQATGITVTSLTGTTATFSWTSGSGSKRALFIKADNTGSAAPVTGTDYTANTVFGSGTQIGSTGWYCAYNGTGNLVNVTGLTPSTGYIAMVTEFNDGGLSNTAQYNTSTATNNPVTLTARATVTAISRTTSSATINTSTADFRVTFNAGMTGLSTSNFGLAASGITGASVTAVTGSGTVFTVTANTGSGDGTLGLNLVNTAGMVPDVTNTLPYTGEVYTVDKTAPTLSPVTIASNNSTASRAKTGDVISLNFTSSEIINTPTISIAGHIVTATNTGSNNWTASYTMTGTDAEGTVLFNIAFSDVNGNAGTTVSATTNSSSVVFDRTAPVLSTVTISTNNSNTSLAKQGNTVTLSFTASETINTPVVTIAGHTVTPGNSSGNNWTASYTMTGTDAEGAVSFSIAFADPTGNVGSTVTGSTNSSNVAYDITAPALSSVTIASANSNTIKAKTGDVMTLAFSSNEAIAPSVTIAGHAVTAVNTGGNNWAASYTMTGTDAEGTIPFSIAYSDASGNAGTTVTTTSNSSSVVFDRTAPSLSPVTIASGNSNAAYAKAGDVVTVNFTGSEPLLSPVMTIATHVVTPVNITANAWTASYTMTGTDAEGNIPVSVAFTDLAGNSGIAVTGTTDNSKVVYDITKPILSVVSIASNNAISSIATPGNTVTISFTANETVLTPTVTLAGHTISANSTGTNTWAAAYTMQLTDPEGTIAYTIAFRDIAGNTGTAVTATTNGSKVIFALAPGPNFAGGSSQGLTLCVDAGLTAINQLLRATDNSTGNTLTWSVLAAPGHGSLSGFNTTAVTNGGVITPAGLGYQPFAGYSGADAFTVRVSDGTLSATTTVNIAVSALPSGSITSTGGAVLCAASSLTLTASGGNTYKWFRDGVLITGNSTSQLVITAPGVYTAVIVNAAGCEASAANSIAITQLQQPKADFTPDANTCINLSLQFTNTSVITNSGTVGYLWNDGKGLTNTAVLPSFSYTQTGAYNVKLKVTPQVCPALADSITKTITIVQAVAGIRNPTIDVVKNQLTQLTVRGLPNATYQWSPAKFLLVPNVASPTIIATAEQEYQISQKVPGGCTTVDTLLVRLHENTTAYLPNVFTPNGDGQNDILMPNLVGVKQLRFFRIFNRWGKMLFETTNIGVGWDGKYNGVLQPLDTYTWAIEGYDGNGTFVKRQGSVTLIR